MELTLLILKALLPLYDAWLKKNAKDAQSVKDYNDFNEIMARRGLQSVRNRLNSNGQIDRIKDEWKKEGNQNV